VSLLPELFQNYTKYFIACVSMEKSDNITHIKRHTKVRAQAHAWAVPHSGMVCSDYMSVKKQK